MPGVVRTIGQLVLMLCITSTPGLTVSPELTRQVAQLHAQFNSPNVATQVRPKVLEDLLTAREQLIKSEGSHPDVLFWRTAQAEDALLQGVKMNALELVVRYGLPGSIQEEMYDHYLRIALEETEAIEAQLPAAIEAAQQGSNRLARLEALRDSRLPMLRGIALILAGERNLVLDPEQSIQEGVQLLSVSIPTLRGEEAQLAVRHLGVAMINSDELESAKSFLEELQRKGGGTKNDQTAIRLALNEITASLSGWAAAAGRAQIMASTNDDPLERLLLIEQAARCWMLHSQYLLSLDDPAEQARYFEAERNAIEAFQLLLPEYDGLQISDPRVIDLLIEERLGRLDIEDLSAEHIPDAMRVAKVVPLVSSETTALKAREVLLPMMDKSGMVPRVRSRMMAMLVRSELTAGMDAEASEHALQWSKIALQRDEAHEAAGLAMAHAIEALRASPDDESLQRLLKQAIDNMLENFPDHPRIDGWRMQAAGHAARSGNPMDAMLIYASIPSDSTYRPAAISQQAILIVETAIQENDQLAGITAARQRLSELSSLLEKVNPKHRSEIKKARIRLDLCEARIDLQDGKPVLALEKLTSPDMDSIEPELAVILHIARVEAAVATGREAAVEAVIDDLPFTVDTEVVLAVLPTILSRPGLPLPWDELTDPAQKKAAWKLAVVLEVGSEASITNRLLIAQAFRRAGHCEQAVEQLQEVLKVHPDLGDALFIKAECLRLDPDADQAEIIEIYSRLSNGEPGATPDRFWTAQLRLLQSMQADGRDPAKIIARLNRLQRTYPDLGGPAYISEFALLRAELSDTDSP